MKYSRNYARAVLADRVRAFEITSLFLLPSDVEALETWLASPAFAKVCADAEVDPAVIAGGFNKIVDDALAMAVGY